jgi:hypothetical protein
MSPSKSGSYLTQAAPRSFDPPADTLICSLAENGKSVEIHAVLYIVNTSNPEKDELSVDHYRILRSEIEHEDQLINHRLSWLVSSQAFLLTAYAISLNAPVTFSRPAYARMNTILFDIVPYAGLIMTILIYPTILAAILMLLRLRAQSHKGLPKGLPPVHGSLLTVCMGLCGPVLIPWVFFLVWTVLVMR